MLAYAIAEGEYSGEGAQQSHQRVLGRPEIGGAAPIRSG